nr:uncharacterized protein LOC105862006 isoform X2 [Microcebus murinus]
MAPASPGYTSPPTIGFSPFQVSVALRRTASYDHSQPVLWPCEPRQERKGPVTFLTPDPLHTVPFSQTLQTSGQPSALAENPGAQIWTTLPRGLQDLGWVFKAEREQRSLPFPCATCALRQRPGHKTPIPERALPTSRREAKFREAKKNPDRLAWLGFSTQSRRCQVELKLGNDLHGNVK